MRDVHLRFRIDRSTCSRSHLSLVFCECLQVIIHKGDTGLAYEISPMYRESRCADGRRGWVPVPRPPGDPCSPAGAARVTTYGGAASDVAAPLRADGACAGIPWRAPRVCGAFQGEPGMATGR